MMSSKLMRASRSCDAASIRVASPRGYSELYSPVCVLLRIDPFRRRGYSVADAEEDDVSDRNIWSELESAVSHLSYWFSLKNKSAQPDRVLARVRIIPDATMRAILKTSWKTSARQQLERFGH
jgi:hypothetical protein